MSDPISKRVKDILNQLKTTGFHIEAPQMINDRPIYSTTLYLATCKVEMTCGNFTAHVFQDIIHKGYIIALAYGDILKHKTLYTRIHSSCVTSETLRACDCDCVEQLTGALELIAKKGKGILFYLMQEGRGVGYLAKSRDRMLVQACNDEISTFEAYQALGLRRDYRQYRNVLPICHMLGINPSFILLTNNPDKVTALKELGMKIQKTETLEYEPSPYNVAYLKSKMDSGHYLKQPDLANMRKIETPEPVNFFKPYALKNAQRFIHSASYFLPIKPVAFNVVVTEAQFKTIFKHKTIDRYLEEPNPLIKSYERLRKKRYKIKINQKLLKKHASEHPNDPINNLLRIPLWFKAHVYFDIATDEDFVILTYGKASKDDIPVVRIQSESLFNRFPVKDPYDREKYKASINAITQYGSGIILLLYSDGRGAGLGAHAQDLMFKEQNLTDSTKESYSKLGVNFDLRDYAAALMLLMEHIPASKRVQIVLNSPDSLVAKTAYTESLNKLEINVIRWLFLEDQTPTFDLV